ncbi:alanine--tRNA ligase [Persicirhabdus sediminis]|uniref:Alanine--tRNA ligase n=1 Tax=Persicirhabdus sediminis TaxID=454144 RepID=A0A8J7SJK8_9BACT|nr:alanine--tRNA ligase [Persicirhabdus sediminis]MBK1790210.1 alanine--tRNA ligase [Persicirhabdus sediminis]
MTAAEIRQSFFDFFKEKQHTIVPSASLMPQSPGLLFTNAGMNQFVPYFLGTEKAPYDPPRAADTQKCIRAGGKHNDLDDVGYDTYHHTMFEMLGNWSFGNYFKPEAIKWAWELVVERWGFPAERLYATVYRPGKGDPGMFDQEAWELWAELFRAKGLDPDVQIVDGNVKDNFWMMGETGPCGPCSELHVDLTPNGDTGGKLVNMDSDLCIEIWNLVFIQYNAEADGSFRDLPAKHVDTGMGFERACSIMQGTKNFTDFSQKPTNYATDVFQPLFRKIEELCGKKYHDIYPETLTRGAASDELEQAIAFRVIADHIRTLSFSIADGIIPGNAGRNYVLRRILRRAVRYGRKLGFSGSQTFLKDLVVTLVEQLGDIFPELIERRSVIEETLEREEKSFNETLDRGLEMFEREVTNNGAISGTFAFRLYDTYGFPIDLTELLCEERNVPLDKKTFKQLMEEQRERSRASRTSELVRAADIATDAVTEFVGFDQDDTEATVIENHLDDGHLLVITDKTTFFCEMGGQHGDQGIMRVNGKEYTIAGVQQLGAARAHLVPSDADVHVGDKVELILETERRRPIEAHHTATHMLHWALHEVVSKDAAQQGSLVTRKRLRFDFNSAPLTAEQIDQIEELVNEKISAKEPVSWLEVPHADVKSRSDIMQFFGDKYGDLVRVVQVGGEAQQLDGYSMELCGGTHVRNTEEIGIFKIKSEGAIASGVRRLEAACGESAWEFLRSEVAKDSEEDEKLRKRLDEANEKLKSIGLEPEDHPDFPRIMAGLLMGGGTFHQINTVIKKSREHVTTLNEAVIRADKKLKKAEAAHAAAHADEALEEKISEGSNFVFQIEASAALLQELLNGLKKKQFTKAAFFIVDDGSKLHLGAYAGSDAQAAGLQAGKLIQQLAPIAGGKGGGRPDTARGAAPQREKLAELAAEAEKALG